jgi:hypothetical protein
MLRWIPALLIALAASSAQASFILEFEPTPSTLQFTPGPGDLIASGIETSLQGGDGDRFTTNFAVRFLLDHPGTGIATYGPIPGADRLTVWAEGGSVAYQGTIIGTSELFTLPNDRYSLSVPLLGTIGPTLPSSVIYPVSLVYTFDTTRPEGHQTESGFIVYGEPQMTGGVPEPSSLAMMGLGLAVVAGVARRIRIGA